VTGSLFLKETATPSSSEGGGYLIELSLF